MGASRSRKTVQRRPSVRGSSTMATGRFLELRTLEWVDRHGTARKWESADRIANQRAVLMIATLQPSNRIILIRQFRPPIGAEVIEFPAGLIDGDESPRTAAARELLEETGYRGTIRSVSGFACSSPGLTGETVALVELTIDETHPANARPKPQPDAGEDIEILLVPRSRLRHFIQQQAKAGTCLDSKIIAYALARP